MTDGPVLGKLATEFSECAGLAPAGLAGNSRLDLAYVVRLLSRGLSWVRKLSFRRRPRQIELKPTFVINYLELGPIAMPT